MSNNENISSNDQQKPNAKAVPFFVRYLEGQFCEELSEEEMEAVGGGYRRGAINKIKADDEDIGGGLVTKKYPSDAEDGGWGGPVMTEKYPSDAEDGTVFPIDKPIATTLKYPSDAEDNPGSGFWSRH